LRKRWRDRPLKILCDSRKINNKILKSLRNSNIDLVENLNFEYGKILLCTGNTSPSWAQKKLLDSDSHGRIITNQNLQLKSFSGIFAAGDCAVLDSAKRPASGVFAVKVVNTLVKNLKKDIEGGSLRKWFPQRIGLQIVNIFPSHHQKAFAIYRNFVFGPSFLFWILKHKIDMKFVNKFRLKRLIMKSSEKNISLNDCRGCAAKIPQFVLNKSLINSNLNSFDVEKFSDAFRSKTNLSKEINFLNSKWVKNFYGIYRDRVWNGSLGEAEIYLGYGSELKKENTWIVNGIKKREFLSFGLANIKAEALNTKNLVNHLKGNLFYSLNQKFPISTVEPEKKSIDTSYKYIPEPITKGLSLNTRLEASYSFYENGDHQEHLGLGAGPELIFGNFKNKSFDYTRLSFFPFYKLSSGESVFKFDQNYDKFTLKIAFDQQLFGPVILKTSGTLNLTNDSDDYGKFIDSKISLNRKKRSYEVGIFYQPHNQAGGISFSLFGFK